MKDIKIFLKRKKKKSDNMKDFLMIEKKYYRMRKNGGF